MQNFPVSKLSVDWSLESLEQPGVSLGTTQLDLTNMLKSSQRLLLKPSYKLPGSEEPLQVGSQVRLRHTGEFACVSCGKRVKKLFEGFCFPCFRSKAMADRCIMSPHTCKYLQGQCREPEWGQAFCFQPHIVYLSFTGKMKVGITRATQLPVRWIDQGATLATVLLEVSSRHQAGLIEKYLTTVMADKTHWQKMLKTGNDAMPLDEFFAETAKVKKILEEVLASESLHAQWPAELPGKTTVDLLDQSGVVQIEYPLTEIPEKFTSTNLDKEPLIERQVRGIKGQYLIFDSTVFNVRRHEGYVIDCDFG